METASQRYYAKNKAAVKHRAYYWKQGNREKVLARARERSRVGRELIREIKLARGCMDCGYRAHPDALDFDHRPGEIKLFAPGQGVRSHKKMLAEIEKCDVVCANCHRIRTAERREGVA